MVGKAADRHLSTTWKRYGAIVSDEVERHHMATVTEMPLEHV